MCAGTYSSAPLRPRTAVCTHMARAVTPPVRHLHTSSKVGNNHQHVNVSARLSPYCCTAITPSRLFYRRESQRRLSACLRLSESFHPHAYVRLQLNISMLSTCNYHHACVCLHVTIRMLTHVYMLASACLRLSTCNIEHAYVCLRVTISMLTCCLSLSTCTNQHAHVCQHLSTSSTCKNQRAYFFSTTVCMYPSGYTHLVYMQASVCSHLVYTCLLYSLRLRANRTRSPGWEGTADRSKPFASRCPDVLLAQGRM